MQPERILLLRSGRHLQVALEALRERFPGCHIGVVGTPGSRPAIEQAGIAPSDAFTYDGTRFQPLAFFFSRTAVAARRWRFSRVAILWNDPGGTGQGNVDRTACLLRPRGYLAITPDGGVVDRAAMPQVTTELRRVVASIGIAALLGLLLYLPALIAGVVRRPVKGRPALVGRAFTARQPGSVGQAFMDRRG